MKENTAKKIHYTWIKYFLIILISIVFLSVIFYNQFERISLNMLKKINREVLGQSDAILGYITDLVHSNTLQMFYDDDITQLRKGTNLENSKIIKSIRTLDSYASFSSSIQSIYIYNGAEDTFYTTSNLPIGDKLTFFDQGAVTLVEERTVNSSKIPYYRFMAKPYSRGLLPVYTYVFFDEMAEQEGELNAIVVNLNAYWIDEVLSNFLKDSEVLVLNEQERIIGKTYNMSEEKKQSIEKMFRHIEDKQGAIITKEGNNKELYLYDVFGATHWLFVRHWNWNDLFYELEESKYVTYIGLFLSLAIIIIVSLVNINRYLNPLVKIERKLQNSQLLDNSTPVTDYVDHLISSSSNANAVKSNYLRHIKVEYFRQLLSKGNLPIEEITKDFASYEIAFKINEPFRMIVFSKDSEKLNSALAERFSTFMYIKMQSCTVVITQEEVVEEQLIMLCESLSCYASLSVPHDWTCNFRTVYERNSEGLSYNMQDKKLVFNEAETESKLTELPIKQIEESAILALLSQTKLEEAFTLYKEYQSVLFNCRLSYIIFNLKRLYLATLDNNETVDDILLNKIEYTILVERNLEALELVFYEIFKETVNKILSSQENRIKTLVKEVDNYIASNLCDKNLGLKIIAENLSLSSVYLGKLYRTEKGYSIAEFINKQRLEKAQTLLLETDLTINEITQKVGFPNTQYFYTLFRNTYHLTPSQWKKKGIENE